ncbi:MAG: hypothetical protein N3G78_03015 [Desulfobacterota bacterium]|nr:hypothetical protein [Thermodesulfobacteriota bacterium]
METMLALLQLLLALFAIYAALTFEEEVRLLVPLFCLIGMFVVGRIEKVRTDSEKARKAFLKSEIERLSQKDGPALKEQNFFTIETLLWPKNELLLLDAVHAIFKDLGFSISPGIQYQSVDRILKIPNTQKSFGVQVMMFKGEANSSHPKMSRILQFEREKREDEKSLIIASTHVHLPMAKRGGKGHITKDLVELLVRYNVSFLTAHHLYDLWQKSKRGEVDIFGFFNRLYTQKGVSPLLPQ